MLRVWKEGSRKNKNQKKLRKDAVKKDCHLYAFDLTFDSIFEYLQYERFFASRLSYYDLIDA
jgi:hypothetical protein